MVKVRQTLPTHADGSVNIPAWLKQINCDSPLVQSACRLSQIAGEDVATPYGKSCFLQSLEIAEMIARLKFGEEAIAAGLVYTPANYADLNQEDIQEQLGKTVSQLVYNTQHLQDIAILKHASAHASQQVDNIRKMLLAMVRDVRVVIIKIAERLCVMRNIHHLTPKEQQRIAQETMDIYAPLASRLGVSELKWELEDLAFSILDSDTYKTIAKGLQEKRLEREIRVKHILKMLESDLSKLNIVGQTQGRAKHIYSIYRKMRRKKVGVEGIYDTIAVRVLVPELDDCYRILAKAHENWVSIPEEFDDYVNNPKPNGYRSIHTAVTDETNKPFEIQIRTFGMHEESEMGVAAHWMYKEGSSASGYEEKIKWLRQLLDWQKELSEDKGLPEELEKNVFEDRIYVFTPEGEIIDLPHGATPLDFAYAIHTELGHRCRGAKISGKMVPLTTTLEMGNVVEILTTKISSPSRDWLIPKNGYLKTTRARAKALHWFKKQDHTQYISEGRALLEKEIKRLGLSEPNLEKLAQQLSYKTPDAMLSAVGHGDLRLAHVLNLIPHEIPTEKSVAMDEFSISSKTAAKKERGDIHIAGVDNLLTYIANCCKPLPGDPIVGYITQGQGISIHHQKCNNIAHLDDHFQNRLVDVEWLQETNAYYPFDIDIEAVSRPGLTNDIAQIVSTEKINITCLMAETNKQTKIMHVSLTIEIKDLSIVSRILDRIQQLPHVVEAKRRKGS